jgi:ubiquinone/menaquinone biosynthesis C-methylase UbiE
LEERSTTVPDWRNASSNWKKWHAKFAEQSFEATQLIIRLGQIHEGSQSILDLASGSGEPSIPIAKILGRTGRIFATDVVANMVSIARDNSKISHLSNMEFEVVSAEYIPFVDQTFDVVTCRFGLTFFPDPRGAMKEVRRVLKSEGRVVLLCWGPIDLNPRFQTTTSVLMRYCQSDKQVTDQAAKEDGLFRFADPGTLEELMQVAGFREIEEHRYQIPWIWNGSVEEAWQSFSEMSAPFQMLFRQLDTGSQENVSREIKNAMSRYYDGVKVNFSATVNTVVATK